MFQKVTNYIKESRDELKKVIWPSKKETTKYTILVIAISLAVAFFLGILDFGLNILLEKII